jgi:flagellar biosynthetic protein FliQ
MPELDVASVLHGGMLATLKMCSPLLLAPLAAGLIIAILQAVTQISDSTISFLPKLVATGVAAWVAGPFLFRVAADTMRDMADKIVAIGGQ